MRLARSLTFVLLVLASCGSPRRPNILVVVIDTLRADRLGCYGNDQGLTPFLDSLAAHGVVFHRAYAQSSWTSPSVASLFTSRFQSQHGVLREGSTLPKKEKTLAEILRDDGYATGGFSANGLLRGRPDRTSNGSRRSGSGFGQGFEHYDARAPNRIAAVKLSALWQTERADEVNRDAVQWLDDLPSPRRSPVFLYLQYMETHIPYAPEEAFLRRTCAGRELPDVHTVNYFAYAGNKKGVDDAMLRDIRATYDAGVMSVDEGLRSLFPQLKARGFLDDAIVVVTADHGQEFKDHGLLGHGKALYEESIRVPLLILVPGQSERVDVWDVVSLVDVAPTLVDWLGIDRPDSFEGRSFRPDLLRGTDWRGKLLARIEGIFASAPRMAYSELIREKKHKRLSPHVRAIVVGSQKLIVGVGGESELYDLGQDPGETKPDGVSEEDSARLRDKLAAVQRRVSPRIGEAGAPTPDPATREILRALGYTDG